MNDGGNQSALEKITSINMRIAKFIICFRKLEHLDPWKKKRAQDIKAKCILQLFDDCFHYISLVINLNNKDRNDKNKYIIFHSYVERIAISWLSTKRTS